MSKDLEAVRALYAQRIKILETRENSVLNSLTPSAKKAFEDLISITGNEEQNRQLEEAIQKIESLISYEYIFNSSDNAEVLQQKIAEKILELDSELKILGSSKELNGLEALSKGEFGKAIMPDSSGVTLVANSDLNGWLVKIMKRIAEIKENNEKKQFTGYLSNLKGEYLEQAVLAELRKRLPKDSVVQGGTMRAGNRNGKGSRQIEEDIFLVYGDGSKATLSDILNNKSYRTKNGRISIPVDLYTEIQTGAAGISVKAGSAPIKFYEGNLDLFFAAEAGDQDVDSYRANVLKRSITGQVDNNEGAIMNRYIVATRLDKAVGSNNLFLATRNKMLTTMSKELQLIQEKGMLSMYYNLKTKAAENAKSGGVALSTITGRIVSPKI